MNFKIKDDYVNIFWEENWYSMSIENIRLYLGLEDDEKITEEIIEKFMKKYF